MESLNTTQVIFIENIGLNRYEPSIEIAIYRICQEAVLNACKYAKCEVIYTDISEGEGIARPMLSIGKYVNFLYYTDGIKKGKKVYRFCYFCGGGNSDTSGRSITDNACHTYNCTF